MRPAEMMRESGAATARKFFAQKHQWPNPKRHQWEARTWALEALTLGFDAEVGQRLTPEERDELLRVWKAAFFEDYAETRREDLTEEIATLLVTDKRDRERLEAEAVAMGGVVDWEEYGGERIRWPELPPVSAEARGA